MNNWLETFSRRLNDGTAWTEGFTAEEIEGRDHEMQRKIQLEQEKLTKNKVVYVEVGGNVFGTLYVDKAALTVEGQKGYPQAITLTLEF